MFKKKHTKEECELKEATETLKILAEELKVTTEKLALEVAKLKGE